VLVFLSTNETTRRGEMVLRTAWNSWTLVDTICTETNTARKQISRNLKVLGATQCKNMQVPLPTRATPTAADLKLHVFGEKVKNVNLKPPVRSLTTGNVLLKSPGVAATLTAPPQPEAAESPNEMSEADLKPIATGCLELLRDAAVIRTPARYLQCLVVSTLCWGMAPRQQVLRQLRLGSSFVKKPDGLY